MRPRRFVLARAACSSVVVLALAACPPPRDDDDDEGRGANRIAGCTEDGGIDLFAVEGDSVLSLSWANHTGQPAAGGYRILSGPRDTDLLPIAETDCTADACEHTLTDLENGVKMYVAVAALDAGGEVVDQSCIVLATPHALAFARDVAVAPDVGGEQRAPALATGAFGLPLFLAFSGDQGVVLTRSQDLGDSFDVVTDVPGAAGATAPALAYVDREESDEPSTLLLAFVQGGSVRLVRGRSDLQDAQPLAFDAPIDLGPGGAPSLAAAADLVAIAFERDGGVHVVASTDDGRTFSAPVRVDGGGASQAPSVAIDARDGDVLVGYHGLRDGGDDDVYLARSEDGGASFGAEVRIDDDPGGGNQRFVSIAVDARTGVVLATWEDRRVGADVYFARSLDEGATFEPSVDVGVGLSGDQFQPRAVADPGRNVYVLFIDQSQGQKPLFSRFNPEGGFDPALSPSTQAGQGGVAASDAVVAVDLYGTVYAAWAENRGSSVPGVFFARAE